uniref:Integral membrane protein n=1 Tax=Streptomyces sp. NBC_00003 TaxID=2903608 RepID=A0AAU2UWD9_9ACTN
MSTSAMTARRPATDRPTPDSLRTVLRIDSWSTAVFGVVMLVGGKWLSDPLGLPTTWSVPFGIAMLGGSAALALIVGYPKIPFRLAATVVVGNTLSCVALLLLAFTDVVPLTGLGRGFMVVGAVVVAVFAEFEFVGLRRSAP